MAMKEWKPITDEDARWERTAKDMIAAYKGDTVRLVKELLISHELQVQQVEYLQGEIERLGKMYPGLFKLAYHEPGDPQATARREVHSANRLNQG